MNANTTEEPAHIDQIAILPTSERYVQQMEDLTALVYHTDPHDEAEMSFNAAHYRQHLAIFPEGQFIAVDQVTDTVVGLTVSMLMNHNPREPELRSWWELTGYG
jgi:hypothetical protein